MLNPEIIKKRIISRIAEEKREFATRSVHLLERPLDAKEKLLIGPHTYEVENEAFLVVIDEAPGAFWTHPVCYELHEVETGEVIKIREKYPLENKNIKAELTELHIPDLPHLRKRKEDDDFFKLARLELGLVEKRFKLVSFDLSRPCVANRHALFVAGMDNMPHFRTDFVIMRNILIERYGYDPDNITIVMGDGAGYPDLPVDYSGTVADLDSALDEYAVGGARELGPDDCLFIYTFNHGDWDGTPDGDVSLCMEPAWDEYRATAFRTKLDNINCGDLIVAMNQCHSGGFIDEVITTTGPIHVAIMTACRRDQSAYPTAVGSHGYLSVALYAALNWEFPAAIDPAFPGYIAGAITAQDSNNDGIVSASEAWTYVHDEMHAHHWSTLNGIETPQYGESAVGDGNNLYWGQPDIEIEDGIPMWESPDVYLHDPTIIPDDTTVDPANPFNWGDYYHPDTLNRIVCRVHNTGCAPCRDITVEFRVMSFGVGGGTTLVGTADIENIDPDHHEFAWIDWDFPSELVHTCVKVRAHCAADPAQAYGAPIGSDDNQAQRNIDPLFAGPGFEGEEAEPEIIERTFLIRNDLKEAGLFNIGLGKRKLRSAYIRPNIKDLEKVRRLSLKAEEEQIIKIRFEVSRKARLGEKLHLPIQIRRLRPGNVVLGGVTFTVEVAEGRLEGRLLSKQNVTEGTVSIENIKQSRCKYTTKINSKGYFSFKQIIPGPYRMLIKCREHYSKDAVFVGPNRVTKKVIYLDSAERLVGGIIKPEVGKLLADILVAVRDNEAKITYLVRTDAKGRYRVPSIKPGEYEIYLPEMKGTKPQKVNLDFLPYEKA
jgi:hypothetical protein